MGAFESVIILSSLLYLSKCQTITITTGQSSNNYLHTTVSWGTPVQSFNVLVDTTDHTSWIYNETVNTPQPKFNPAESSTFVDLGTGEDFIYQTETTSIKYANETFSINSQSITHKTFGIATKNFSITDNEGLSGFLSLDRLNTITSGLHNNGFIENESISIDVANNKMYLGPYSPSSSDILNQSNRTYCSSTSNKYLPALWTFNITVSINGVPALGTQTFKGVIDSASPFITIYARTPALFDQLWILIDRSPNTNALHCNYTTRLCSDTSIMDYMTIFMEDVNWNLTFFKDDVLSGSYIQFFYDPDRDFTDEHDTDFVLFLGRPFLQHTLITMNYQDDSMIFYILKQSTSSLNWITIGVVFAAVIAFALLFFGIYYWKYGKISPPSNNDVEEQSHSLLRGPVQAVGTGQGAINQGLGVQSSGFSGISGLDEDDDDYQHQLQQVQRQSAIEAQQKREQQMRIERERQMEEEQKQQSQSQQVQRQSVGSQRIGSKKGNDAIPADKEELRRKRLAFLEEQQKQQNDDDDDDQDDQ